MQPVTYSPAAKLPGQIQTDRADAGIVPDPDTGALLQLILAQVIKGVAGVVKDRGPPFVGYPFLQFNTGHQQVLAADDFSLIITGTKGLILVTANTPVPPGKIAQ